MLVQDSRNKRPLIMPLPASSQSMTGSAYSRSEAVKMMTVYQEET